ncbi:MAG: flagellar biosynthesis protein FlgL, partial [Gammaproteobacteria bacterium]|nr:flagellar biosynthesis protein FlgL [Gammaproteobacteria bacterium]
RRALEDNPDTPQGNRDTRDAVAIALTNIDHAMVNIDATRGDIGARLNVIETTKTDNEDVALINKTVQAELREVDYPEALSRLAFQSIVLEAAQQSYVRISQINLFNKI